MRTPAHSAMFTESAEGSAAGTVAIDALPDATAIVDAAGTIIAANASLCAMFGYGPTELIGRQVELLIPDRFHSAHRAHRARYQTEPRARPMDSGTTLYARRRDGTEIPVEISLSPLQTPAGTCVLASIRDVTQRRAADLERERIMSVLDIVHDSILIVDPRTFEIVYANRGAAEQLGYTPDELRGMNALDAAPDYTTASATEAIEPLVSGRTRTVQLEITSRRKDGSTYPTETTVNLVRTRHSDSAVLVAVNRDISERKAYAAEREGLLSNLRDVCQLLDVEFWQYDASGRITMAEGVGRGWFPGHPALIGRSGPDDVLAAYPEAAAALRRALAGEHIEYSMRAGPRWRRIVMRPIVDDDGRVARVVGMSSDVTAIEEARAAADRARQRLEDISRNASCSMFVIDAEGRVVFAIGPWSVPDGGDPQMVRALATTDGLAEHNRDQRGAFIGALKRALAGEVTSVVWHAARHHQFRFHPTFDDAGRVSSVVGVMVDVTELESARERIEQQRNHLDSVLGAIPDGLVLTEHHRIVEANARFCELVGYTMAEIEALKPPYPWWSYAEHRDGEPIEADLARRDGTRVPVGVVKSWVGDPSDQRQLVLVHDLSDERRIAAQLRDAQMLVALVDERERIARDLHDRVIQRVFAVGLGLQGEALRARDERAASRLIELTDDLDLAIRDLRTSIFSLHAHQAQHRSLGDVARDICSEATRPLGFSPSLSIDPEADALTSPELASEMGAALREVLSNVARHARATECRVTLGCSVSDFVLHVADNGAGIPVDMVAGSGLANLHARAEKLGGRCTVSCSEGGGTEITWIASLQQR